MTVFYYRDEKMKVLLLYYSQTGNTQKIAWRIRDGIKASGYDVYVRTIKDMDYSLLEKYELIGLGTPVWCADPPILRKFFDECPRQSGKLAFTFCTHGTMPALYFPVVNRNLRKLGFRVIGWKDWYGDCTLQVFPSPYFTAGHPDETDLSEAFEFGGLMAENGKKILEGDESLIPLAEVANVPSSQASAVCDLLSSNHSAHGDLTRDEEKCLYPKCHICQDNCPMGYIKLEDSRYGKHGTWCGDGHGCSYCELLCPTGAIHPVVPYEELAPVGVIQPYEMFHKILDKAEEEGKFRRLIEYDEVGNDTPYYYMNPKHPRIRPLSVRDDN